MSAVNVRYGLYPGVTVLWSLPERKRREQP